MNILASITAKILQCGKSFKLMQIRGNIFPTREYHRENSPAWNWGVRRAVANDFYNDLVYVF